MIDDIVTLEHNNAHSVDGRFINIDGESVVTHLLFRLAPHLQRCRHGLDLEATTSSSSTFVYMSQVLSHEPSGWHMIFCIFRHLKIL